MIVMMFLAMATSFDDTMAADPQRGALGYLVGFLFAVVVTESVLRTIRLRLPGWYRAAYYAILAVVFLYPIATGAIPERSREPATAVGTFRILAAGGARALFARTGGEGRRVLRRQERQPMALAALSMVALLRDRPWSGRSLLFALCLVPLRQRQPHDLRPLLPGSDRPGGESRLARDRDCRAAQERDARRITHACACSRIWQRPAIDMSRST